MKKNKVLKIFKKVILPFVFGTSLVLTATSCSLIYKLDNPIPETPKDIEKPNTNPSTKPKEPNKPIVETLKVDKSIFKYNNQEYKVGVEDILLASSKPKATLEVANDETKVAKLFPDIEDYDKVNNLTDYVFPTIANASIFIRTLLPELLKNNYDDFKLLFNKVKNTLDTRINEYEKYLKLWRGRIEALRVRHGSDLVGADYPQYGSYSKMKPFGRPSNVPYMLKYHPDNFIGVDLHTEGYNTNQWADGTKKRVPSIIWKLNRAFTGSGSDVWRPNGERIDSEMFLSREFYEKTIDKSTEELDVDWLDWLYANNSSALALQYPQLMMLKHYLNVIDIVINGNWDVNLSFAENAIANKLYAALYKYEDALLEYMKLENILGITVKPNAKVNLQMFPGGNSYLNKYSVDFRDSYKWAYSQYEDFVYPLLAKLDSSVNRANKFNTAFVDNAKRAEKYKMIWANIKFIDEVNEPYKLTNNQVDTQYAKQLLWLENNLNVKYKKN